MVEKGETEKGASCIFFKKKNRLHRKAVNGLGY